MRGVAMGRRGCDAAGVPLPTNGRAVRQPARRRVPLHFGWVIYRSSDLCYSANGRDHTSCPLVLDTCSELGRFGHFGHRPPDQLAPCQAATALRHYFTFDRLSKLPENEKTLFI